MMTIKIESHDVNNFTLVPNIFIDNYLVGCNGDFVKVYLLLLRFSSSQIDQFSLTDIADKLELTESDITRALKFWESKNILKLTYNENSIESISLLPITLPKDSIQENKLNTSSTEDTIQFNISNKPNYSMKDLASFMEQTNYKQLIYVTERFLGKNLHQQDLATLISFHDWLGLPLEVIELLIEYCASNNKTNLRYIEKVAIDWADLGIDTVQKAKVHMDNFNKKYYAIKKALGLANRTPVAYEIKLMDKWIDEYSFDMELILEACDRTMKTAPNGSFKYTDKIITSWHKNKVTSLEDIKKLDELHKSKNYDKTNTFDKSKNNDKTKPNKFINYSQREYDFNSLEKKAFEFVLKENNEGVYSS